MASKLGICCCCAIFAIVFVAVFFSSLSASVDLANVHHVLQDAAVSNISVLSRNSTGTIESATVVFKVWSRNANKVMGVRFWHLRIALVYSNHELGRAFALPFVQPPRNITQFEAPLRLSNLTVPADIASKLKADVESGEIAVRIYVKMRAVYARADRSWKTKLVGRGELHGDDKCNLVINNTSVNNGSSSLKGRQCGWTVRQYTEDQDSGT